MNFFQSTLTVSVLSIAFVSCKKENVTKPVVPVASTIQTCLKFNGNLTDSTGKLATANQTGAISYTTDHNGNVNRALFLDGASKVVFPGLDLKGKAMTISLWVKYGSTGGGAKSYLTAINANGGPSLYQVIDKLGTSVSLPNTNSVLGSATLDATWHHFATTYDGVDIKVYEDGVLTGTVNHPGSMGDGVRDLVIGFSNAFWGGALDELRIYNTVMTPGDIQQLAAQ
ncbi:MAG: LamG domain-containing protein [Bacteroidota bacterium]|nr:LamG domain-containing protein [Bacteroidota bacterium]